MLVNFTFKGFFNNRLVGSGVRIPIAIRIWIIMAAFFFIASSFTKRSDRDSLAKQVNLIIRQIGHRLLLQSGDSTSRVLPVTEIKDGTFLLEFENEFVFNHDSLMMLSQHLLPKTQFPSGYTVTVHECTTASIIYGFQINNTSPDILACRGRNQPPGCYTIEIAFTDFYKDIEQNEASIDQATEELKSSKVDAQKSNSIPVPIGAEELKTTTIDQVNSELKSLKVALPEGSPTPIAIGIGTQELKTTIDYPFISLVCSGMLALLSFSLLIGRFGKSLVPVPMQNQVRTIISEPIKTTVSEFTALGKFLFDVKGQRLLLGNDVISLTDKECRILELLNNDFGELISRETLMRKIWIDEGVITGRSLDMFVSKLRKKLSPDPELRITNIHGKGYKLETPEIQIL
jgi:DNA-binding winged helix-turn-helix (wHTH) protein